MIKNIKKDPKNLKKGKSESYEVVNRLNFGVKRTFTQKKWKSESYFSENWGGFTGSGSIKVSVFYENDQSEGQIMEEIQQKVREFIRGSKSESKFEVLHIPSWNKKSEFASEMVRRCQKRDV